MRRVAPKTNHEVAFEEFLARSPAHSAVAERGVIGSIFVDHRCLDDVVLVIEPAHFHDEAYRTIYETCVALHNAGKRPDPTLVVSKLGPRLEQIGGMSTLLDIVEGMPTAANAVWYAETVREKYIQRYIAAAAAETLRDATDPQCDVKELAERFETRAFAIGDRRVVSGGKSVYDVMQLVADELDARSKGKAPGMKTGWYDVDAVLSNLRPGTLTLIAARPSMGKSALAANIAVNVAERNEPVCFFSLEMSELEIGERMLSARARVPLHTMQQARPSSDENRRLVHAQSELSTMPLYLDDASSLSMSEIAAVCRRHKRRHGLALVIVDYLQIIRPENQRDRREEQIGEIARRLKSMARELQVPVVALSQLNRATEQAAGNRPKLSNLRESGSLEQDADNVLFVHREEYYMPDGPAKDAVKNEAELIIAKQRNGKRGVTVKLTWLGHIQQFENAAPSDRSSPPVPYDFD